MSLPVSSRTGHTAGSQITSDEGSAFPRAPSQPLIPTARELAADAQVLYAHGPFLFRKLQHLRPFICPFEALLPFVPPRASILDVGCGGGLWLNLLARRGLLSSGIGFDSSRAAIDLASAAAHRALSSAKVPASLTFLHLDVRAPWPDGTFNAVSIIDVMHHVPPASQRDVLALAAAHVAPGGVLIYKDMCRRPHWRASMNRLHDLVMARQWIHYCPVQQVEQWAGELGLSLIHAAFHSRYWYGHELRVFTRPA